MAKNPGAIEQAMPINLNLAVPSGKVSGDVIALSDMTVYLQTDRDSAGNAVCTIPCRHVRVVSVKGEDHAGNATVAVGDKLYLDTGVINKDSTDGKPFGYALDAVTSGATTTIRVGFGL
jgi:hypothetical protein